MTRCGTVGHTASKIAQDEHYSKSTDMWVLRYGLYTLLLQREHQCSDQKVARGYYAFLSPRWDDVDHSAKDLILYTPLSVHHRQIPCVSTAHRCIAPQAPPTPLIYVQSQDSYLICHSSLPRVASVHTKVAPLGFQH
ncbi:hypothetical protein BD779DRAFT_281734 [Infundibulicybe gibba]|nr:hypothetical protein BD779DRAFT_281734 [Infundibulicybe gibba]